MGSRGRWRSHDREEWPSFFLPFGPEPACDVGAAAPGGAPFPRPRPLGRRGAGPEAGGVLGAGVVGGVVPVVGVLVAELDEQVADLVAEELAVGAAEERLP